MRLDGVKKGCYCAFSFGPFVRLILSSGAPSQTHSQRPPNRACPKNGQAPALNFFYQKPSELPRPAAKRATKKSPEQFAMNYSGLFFFTQGLLSTLLGKGQNWEQNWDGFGWGKLKIGYFASFAISSAKFSCFFSMPSPFSKRTASFKVTAPPSFLAAEFTYCSTVTSLSLTKVC